MDLSLERDSTAIGSLFQQIIADMKNTSPLWEDFVAKASKLHACLRAAIQAIAAYLDAFQKIADAATNSRGASKEIGTALTRVCLRHKAVETRMKTFTAAIMDCLITPLQDKLEDWKRQVASLDKEHAKEYKRCRTELKKRSSDTLRLQKKARKGQSDTIQSLVDSHMHDVTMRRVELEDVEKKSLRAAMIEERMRYCSFVNMLQPVVKEECEVMSELGHLQEAMQSIAIVTKEPNVLPQSSEELILESKSSINLYPESPGGNSGSQGCSNSLGSRKSSVCSISSMNSSGSSGSPGHHYQRSLSQLISPAIRLKPGESSDSGFCSSPALTSQASANTSQSHAVSTWPPHSQDVVQTTDRPHTISSAYEKGHQRPALTVYTFQNPETIIESQKSPATMACRPPLPVRCSSLERPLSATGTRNNNVNLMQRQCPSPIPVYITKELPQLQPTYVNMSELASMAASKITNQQQMQHKPQQPQPHQLNSLNSNQSMNSSQNSSMDSSSLGVTNHQNSQHHYHLSQYQQQTNNSSPDFSLISNTIISSGSTVTMAGISGTTPSSGGSPASTSHNNSPQLTNNPNSPQTPITTTSSSITTPITTSSNSNQLSNNTIGTIISGSDNELKITETDNNLVTTITTTSTNNSILSPEKDDDISRCSVLEKTSMFEKLEQKQTINNNLPILTTGRSSHTISTTNPISDNNTSNIYGNRKEDIYKASGGNDKDPDQIYEDSIQELNNLIGELDSFQREHELNEHVNQQQQQPEPEHNELQQSENQQEIKSHQHHNDQHKDQNIIQSSNIDTDSDKISIGSLNYSTQSTNASDAKFNYSDSEISRYVSESSSLGYENPTFAHFNNNNQSNNIINNNSVHDEIDLHKSKYHNNINNDDSVDDSSSSHLMVYDQNYVVTPDIDYLRQNSEIVVLRYKETTPTTTKPSSITTISGTSNGQIDSTHNIDLPKQRLSSFRSDQQLQLPPSSIQSQHCHQSFLVQPHLQDPQHSQQHHDQGCVSRITRRSSINTIKPPPPVRRSSSVTPSHNLGAAPNSPNLIQQNMMNTSAENLPPPPAFMLDRAGNASPTINVAETVKALTVIRHMPASPSTLRRAQNQLNQTPTIQNTNPLINNTSSNTFFSTSKNDVYTQQPTATINTTNTDIQNHNSSFRTPNSTSPGIYAQPKQVTKMSSFRTPNPGPQKANSSLLAQLNARLTPKQSQQATQQQSNDYSIYHQQHSNYPDTRNQQQQQQLQHQQQGYNSSPNSPHHQQRHHIQSNSEQIYSGERYYYGTGQQQQQQQFDDYTSSNEKTGSIRSKTKAEFLENLNAKLAKQGLSGRAFAVRNLINSKALPDPRLCHESLMDQIKRGATLKRNRTINDRSAPKIH